MLLARWIVKVRAEQLKSSIGARKLIKTHKFVTDCLQKGNGHPVLNNFSTLYKREHRRMEVESDFVGNPINAFLLIKRLTTDLNHVEKYIPWIRNDSFMFPDEEDLRNAMSTLWRLQVIYELNVTHLAAGKLYGRFSHDAKPYFEEGLPMLISDCEHLMQFMYQNYDYDKGLLWALESFKKYHNKEPDEIYQNDDEAVILHHILTGYIKIGKYEEATKWTRKFLSLQPGVVQNILQSKDLADIKHPERSRDKNVPIKEVIDLSFDGLEDLCRGKVQLPHEKRKRLYCFFKLGPNPFLRLAPFKAEHLHEDPPIFIFYDVASNANIKVIQGIEDQLIPSTVSNEKGEVRADRRARISSSLSMHYLWPSYPAVKSATRALFHRAGHFSDLKMEFFEDSYVLLYGIGEHYRIHHDFFPTPSPVYGHRTATVLFYLSDVDQGGATVFAQPRLTVFPTKGAALMWYNILPSGKEDYRTLHAACPVLRGFKWVISLWIHSKGQEFHRPCTLEYQENHPK